MAFHALTIGTSALRAAQYGLQVTGQNLGNVDTAGYSRQRINQSGVSRGRGTGGLMPGSGVSVDSVSRVVSAQAEKQLRKASSAYTYSSEMAAAYTNLQSVFMELSGVALSDDMSSFWNSLSEMSGKAENLSHRTTLLEDARALTDHFNNIHANLQDARKSYDGEVEGTVKDINNLLNEIADLNAAIVSGESGGLSPSQANDLRDSRGEKLRALGELVDVDTMDESNGSVVVSIAGRLMVYHDQAYGLEVRKEDRSGMQVSIPAFANDKYPLKSPGGKLGADMTVRDEILPGYMDELDDLAAVYTWEFNRAYSQTRGEKSFDGITSRNGPIDPAVALNQLRYKADYPEGTFQIVNGNLEVMVHNRNTGEITSVPVEIDLDGRPSPSGEPDMILWDPNDPEASHSFINRLRTELDKAVPGAFTVDIDSESRVSIASNNADYGFCFGKDSSGILAALGMNTFFTGHNASDIGVNDDLSKTPELIGTGYSFEAGDNDGVVDMLSVLENPLDRLGGRTAEDYYLGITGRLGSEAGRNKNRYALNLDLYNRAFVQRESISGVNEDEEVIKLITYQRAYQSAARYISVVNEFYDALVNM
ncbi:MAG: flagellar hook-associated protein FlgK [Planctomycetota bacterium]|jgi:flagellar hook-associated protein 1 FlgK|nr:flagellar hook-associated protein FlgK [Planctomycetota bacterium]